MYLNQLLSLISCSTVARGMCTLTRNVIVHIFSAANRYVLCVMTATILGCSLRSANVYFNILNQTISNIFQARSYQCYIYHPMDVVSLYTTTSSTVTMTTKGAWSTITTSIPSDKTEQYRVSGSVQLKAGNVVYLMYSTIILIVLNRTFVYQYACMYS